MPAVITHDFFGQRVLAELEGIELNTDMFQAFLLGNQGPDPFFYAVLGLRTRSHPTLGKQMHCLDPARIFQEWNRVIWDAPLAHRDIIRSFAAGFVCHYLLDSYVHPLVVAQQRAYCNAGVEGLTEADQSDVHIFMERDIDEVMLYTTTGMTVADYDPSIETLQASDWVLDIISHNMATVVWHSMGLHISNSHFARCVKQFRFAEHVFHSPTGLWRERLSSVDSKFRKFSFCRNMMLRPVEAESTPYMNPDHDLWIDPFSGKERTESFYDLSDIALAEAVKWIPQLFSEEGISVDTIRKMTEGYNYSGDQQF